MNDALQKHCDSVIGQMFERCRENAPNFGVSSDCFSKSLNSTLARFAGSSDAELTDKEVTDFLGLIQADDLFLAGAHAARAGTSIVSSAGIEIDIVVPRRS